MDRLEAMSVFAAIVDGGSLSAAGRRLNVPLATVSRKLADLEAHLKTRLITRSTRKLVLTDAGRDYLDACRQILEQVDEAELAASGAYAKVKGQLVVAAPIVFGRLHVVPVAAAFLEAYPEVDIQLRLGDRNVNLIEEHVDVALRIGALPDSNLVATQVGTVRRVVCASPAYLERFGTPQSLADIDSHRIVSFGLPIPAYLRDVNWLETAGRTADNPREPILTINNIFAIKAAVSRGIGIAVLPDYLLEEDAGLVRLLPETPVPSFATYFVYPSELKNSARVNVFRDFLLAKAQDWSY